MTTSATTAAPIWRTRKYQLDPKRGSTRAMIEEALYTIRRPKATSSTTVMKRNQSVLSRCAILGFLGRRIACPTKLIHQLFESFAAVLETAELIEAGAGRGEEHGIAGVAMREAIFDGGV